MMLDSSAISLAVAFAATASTLWALYILWQFLFSPLRKIPGPFWAKFSPFWLWLHDISGTSPEVIDTLHREHGPIVRLGPNEVSVSDFDVHNSVLYCQAPKFLKAAYYYDTFRSGPRHIFTALDPAEHSLYRRLVSRAFSRKSILNFESEIHNLVQEALSIFRQNSKAGAPVDITKVFRSLALDFITKFTYGGSLKALKAPNLDEPLLDAFDQFATSNFLFMMFPALRVPAITILSMIPSKVFQAVPSMRKGVEAALAESEETQANSKGEEEFKPLLMSELQAAEALQRPLSKDFLLAEGVGSIFAGTDTTSTMLYLTFRELCLHGEMYERLHQELKLAMPVLSVQPRLIDLEALPYLSACVKEGLRFACPARSRLPRVCPAEGWEYEGNFLPGGTIVSSSPRLMCFNEEVFPNPGVFLPDRWISDDVAYLKKLEEVAAPFSKGSRSCIGRNLALAEIYITMASVARHFKPVQVLDRELKTYETFGVVAENPIRVMFEEAKD